MSFPAEVAITESVFRRVDPSPGLSEALSAAGIARFSVAGLPPLLPGLIPLVPDLDAAERAAAAGYDSLALVAVASDQFAEAHYDGTVDELMHRIRRVLLDGPLEVSYRAYLETVTHCPYEGQQEADWVAHLAETLVEWGAEKVVLVESVGRATPYEIERVLFEVQEGVQVDRLGMRLSNVYGMAMANTMSAMDAGVASFESTAGGIDDFCATEDLVYLLDGLGVVTGIDAVGVATPMIGFCESRSVDYKSRAGRALVDAEEAK